MANNPIPVYVFTGFLESGKTKFIKEILADPNFTENEVTALLLWVSRNTTKSGSPTTAPLSSRSSPRTV